jgi:type IX secretion system PorP/SprF family membrane protein
MYSRLDHRTLQIAIPAVIWLCLFFSDLSAQQKVQFTQYMFNPLVINPAYAGADEALSVTFVQRSQWLGLDNAPVTQSLSGHTAFMRKHIGVGLTLVNDKIGVHKNLTAVSNYAYHIAVGEKSHLSMGLLAGIHNQRSDYNSLVGYQNADPKLYNPFISHTFFDFGAGLYFRSPRLNIGLSAPEILPGRVNVNDTLSIRMSAANYYFFSQYRFPINEGLEAQPSFLIKYLPGLPVSFDLNMNLIFRKVLTMGISYRKSESIDFLLKGTLTPQLQFGYSYDHVVGDVARVSNGSHELMIHYLFRYVQSNAVSPR